MLILLTNDDGICAPGLVALERELRKLGEVYVVAPATEQSGVGHGITYLTPIIAKEVFIHGEHWGWAVEGTPADCVKLGVSEFCPRKPDLIVSGINGGLNAGINILYSGTMAAAVEGAFFEIPSIAVSLEFDDDARFDLAAQIAVSVIRQVLDGEEETPRLLNLNIPTAALDREPEVHIVPMDVKQYWETMERRTDPAGRAYYWVTGGPKPEDLEQETDLSALGQGHVALTPLDFDMTHRAMLGQLREQTFNVEQPSASSDETPLRGPDIRYRRTK